ncbi:MAG: helicase HerA domain-containing protein [Methanosarcinaceae archaeon]
MNNFFNNAAYQNHPLRALKDFLDTEIANETAKKYDDMRFVGYALEINYDTVTIITSDPFKIAVGGVPRNSLLVMTPSTSEAMATPHFTLLRVLDAAPTPLSKDTQQTYFELQKKSMPELDVFTQSELQWGALSTAVLGMFYPNPDEQDRVEFSGDLNNFVSAHKYKVYAPDDELLDLVVNSLVPENNRFTMGKLRLTECRLPLPSKSQPNVKVSVSTQDFLGARTAMFGKTRLGKSNVVKLIAQSLIETYHSAGSVGQLIFDINGEYANDNPQDGNKSLRSGYPKACYVYAINQKKSTVSSPLKLNFYEQPDSAQKIIESLLNQDGKISNYIRSYASVELSSVEDIRKIKPGSDQVKTLRKLQMFWAILKKAGFPLDEAKLKLMAPTGPRTTKFNPAFSKKLREVAYEFSEVASVPASPESLTELVRELEVVEKLRRDNPSRKELQSTGSSGALFDADAIALLEFLVPKAGGSGSTLLRPYIMYHDTEAGDFVKEILRKLDKGSTVILDMGNAHPVLMDYFSKILSKSVFKHQVEKFSNDELGKHYIQLYFEEAHNLFPRKDDVGSIYSRFAKEGAKYHIGMVYSTQSPTTIGGDLLAQTENFFIAHMSSQDEVNTLAKMNVAFDSMKDDILRAKTPGYVRMLTQSHRFVVSVQAKLFKAPGHTEEQIEMM